MFYLHVDDEIKLNILQLQELKPLHQLISDSREHLQPYITWIRDANEASVKDFIQSGLHAFARNQGFNAGIYYREKLAGYIGLHYIHWSHRKTEIGYWLGASYTGKGIMIRSCKALLNYIFNYLHLHRVTILCGKENVKSRAIPKGLQFVEEGFLRDAEWLYDHYIHLVMYSMLKHEWERIYSSKK
ncbi:GNAT family N-acetyltransferase [Longirhabdus pacifica]|uniref:GNAT family N-acetyltransferase n=1 Tax=Longirhabdus pacifica TaxID=2305227 RepID=UPI0013E89BE9|nr:GNAT family N-acetyltransferase [Longirhabdus pacifica]